MRTTAHNVAWYKQVLQIFGTSTFARDKWKATAWFFLLFSPTLHWNRCVRTSSERLHFRQKRCKPSVSAWLPGAGTDLHMYVCVWTIAHQDYADLCHTPVVGHKAVKITQHKKHFSRGHRVCAAGGREVFPGQSIPILSSSSSVLKRTMCRTTKDPLGF